MSKVYGLDGFCGGGGATAGYMRAARKLGIDLVMIGVDHQPHEKSYLKAGGTKFIRGDMMEVFQDEDFMSIFDFVHISPSCQKHSALSRMAKNTDGQLDLITPSREYFWRYDAKWIMENVEGSPLIDPLMLCGSMFDDLVANDPRRQLRRHRLFEIVGFEVEQPPCAHNGFKSMGVYGAIGRKPPNGADVVESLEEGRKIMGVDWPMSWKELREAIPPAYTEYIGMSLLPKVQ
ncbi:MAG TPA: hypothetical protein VIY48_18100 [Candidatus Paceibacterota bacterium]